MSHHDIKPLKDRANNSHNYILGDLVNSLAKKSDNKDGKNIIDKGKAENYNDGSDNSDDTDNNDSGDGDSSDSNEGNEARGCTTSIINQSKTKHAAKHHL